MNNIRYGGNSAAKKIFTVGALMLSMGSAEILAQSRYVIEEVLITSRKVEEGLQDAPIAISAFTGSEMENRGAMDVTDVASAAPNVTLEIGGATSGMSAAPVTFIRGIGQSDFVINTDAAVGLYVDGVYMGRSLGSVMDLVDLERVEVLRGPQGTLFGRNTIGGAISLISKEPSIEDGLYGNVSATIGENGYQMLRGTANVPLTDNSAARFTAFTRQRDGYMDAVQYDDFQLGAEDVMGFRASFKADLSDSLTLTAAYDYSDRNDSPAALRPLDLGDAGVVDVNGNSADGTATGPIGLRFNTGNGVPAAWLATENGPVSGQFINNDGSTQSGRTVSCSDATLNNNRQCYGDAWIQDSSFENNSVWTDPSGTKIEPEQELEVMGGFVALEWDTEAVTIKSISSYREFDAQFYNDNDFTPYIIFHNNHPEFSHEQFSQEFQLTGSVNEKLDYVGGLFYFEEEGLETIAAQFPNIPPCAASNEQPSCFTSDRFIENDSTAGYAQFIYHPTVDLHLTLGLRRTESTKTFLTRQTTNTAGGAVITEGSGTLVAKETDYMFNAAWDAAENAMVYFNLSTGFRDGGFPARFPTGIPDVVEPFLPEYVDAYELGIKSDWFDNALQLNAAIFQTDYSDIQVDASSASAEGAPTIFNLASATLRGLEVEAIAVLNDNLRVDAAIGYLDSSIDSVTGGELISGAGNTAIAITTDNVLPYNPEWQINLGLNYSHYVDDGAEIRTRLDYQYVAEQYYVVTNRPGSLADSYSRVNINASYIPANSNWELTAGIKNLTDEEYSTAGQFATINASSAINVSRPREAYLQLKYNFGE